MHAEPTYAEKLYGMVLNCIKIWMVCWSIHDACCVCCQSVAFKGKRSERAPAFLGPRASRVWELRKVQRSTISWKDVERKFLFQNYPCLVSMSNVVCFSGRVFAILSWDVSGSPSWLLQLWPKAHAWRFRHSSALCHLVGHGETQRVENNELVVWSRHSWDDWCLFIVWHGIDIHIYYIYTYIYIYFFFFDWYKMV